MTSWSPARRDVSHRAFLPASLRSLRSLRSLSAAAFVGLLPLVLLLGLWEVQGSDNSPYVPRPSTWWAAVEGIWETGLLSPAIRSTATTFVLAIVLATLLGSAVGVIIGTSDRVQRSTSPLLEFLRTLPPPAIVPVALLLLGPSRTMQVSVVVLAAIWPIVINTTAAVRGLHPVTMDASRSLHLTRGSRFRKVTLPCVIPAVLLGLRVSASICVLITLLVEMLVGASGIGSLLLQAQRNFLSSQAFGLMVVAGVFGLVVNTLVGVAEARLLRSWPPRTLKS